MSSNPTAVDKAPRPILFIKPSIPFKIPPASPNDFWIFSSLSNLSLAIVNKSLERPSFSLYSALLFAIALFILFNSSFLALVDPFNSISSSSSDLAIAKLSNDNFKFVFSCCIFLTKLFNSFSLNLFIPSLSDNKDWEIFSKFLNADLDCCNPLFCFCCSLTDAANEDTIPSKSLLISLTVDCTPFNALSNFSTSDLDAATLEASIPS